MLIDKQLEKALLELGAESQKTVLAIGKLVISQEARFRAMKAMLTCMVYAHPNPSELLERYLAEMDMVSDGLAKRDVEKMRGAFAEFVEILTVLTKRG